MTTTGTVLFALDVVFAAVAWPIALWCAGRLPFTALSELPIDVRMVGYPLADLLVLFAMELSAATRTWRRASRLPGCRSWWGWARCWPFGLARSAGVRCIPVHAARRTRSGTAVRAGDGVPDLTAFASRLVLSGLLEHRVLRRHLLVVGAGERAWDLLRMLTKEGSNLQYDIAFLHDPSLGEVDPRLAADPAGRIMRREGFSVLQAARDVSADESWSPPTSEGV